MELRTALSLFAYAFALGFAAIFGVVIWKMMKDKIDLALLVSDDRKASLSRFQLFVFTFVVAGLFLILSLQNSQIVEIPNSVLGLLGISGGSYLISKGLPAAKEPGAQKPD